MCNCNNAFLSHSLRWKSWWICRNTRRLSSVLLRHWNHRFAAAGKENPPSSPSSISLKRHYLQMQQRQQTSSLREDAKQATKLGKFSLKLFHYEFWRSKTKVLAEKCTQWFLKPSPYSVKDGKIIVYIYWSGKYQHSVFAAFVFREVKKKMPLLHCKWYQKILWIY